MISRPQWDAMILYMRMVLDGYKGRYMFRSRITHSLRVTQWAQRIWNEDGQAADPEVLLAAAILHDIGYSARDGEDHGEWGAGFAEQYLRNEGYEESFTQKVCYLIRLHSHKEYLKMPEKAASQLTPELQILMEADLLDECGPMAVVFDCMAEAQEEEQSFEKTYQRILKSSPDFLECNWMISPSARSYWEDRQILLRDYLNAYQQELFLMEKMPEEYEKAAVYMTHTMKGHELTPNRRGVIYPFRRRDMHMFRVFYQARRLFKEEKARQKDRRRELSPYGKRVLSYAALLHDIGYRRTTDGLLHAEAGASMALEYMRGEGLPEELCQDTAALIRAHADKRQLTEGEQPILLQLLMEADHQDESGAMSLAWDAMASAMPEAEMDSAFERQLDYDKALERMQRFTAKMFRNCEYRTAAGKELWQQKGRLVDRFLRMFQYDLKEWEPIELLESEGRWDL